MKCWNAEVLKCTKCWDAESMKCWNARVLKCQNVEILKYQKNWNAEILKCWKGLSSSRWFLNLHGCFGSLGIPPRDHFFVRFNPWLWVLWGIACLRITLHKMLGVFCDMCWAMKIPSILEGCWSCQPRKV